MKVRTGMKSAWQKERDFNDEFLCNKIKQAEKVVRQCLFANLVENNIKATVKPAVTETADFRQEMLSCCVQKGRNNFQIYAFFLKRKNKSSSSINFEALKSV